MENSKQTYKTKIRDEGDNYIFSCDMCEGTGRGENNKQCLFCAGAGETSINKYLINLEAV